MAEVLIVYGSREGHTALVADHLRRPLETAGHIVRACPLDEAPTCPMLRWIKGNAEQLNRLPSAFFQVSLSSAGAADGSSGAEHYVEAMLSETGWRPGRVGSFAGALLYTKYGLVKRSMVRSIARSSGLGTDVRRDYDYTDYAAVAQFARDAEALLYGVSRQAV
jgi:menaquinone-dependent protoporphyrinogen oxidase